MEADQEIRGEVMNEEIGQPPRASGWTTALCALSRYTSRQGTLITSLNWHVAEDFRYRMKLLKNI